MAGRIFFVGSVLLLTKLNHMLGKLSGWDDTIIALATPSGVGAIGVLRLSGPAAFTIVNELFPSKDLLSQPSHTLHVGFIKEGDLALDEVVVALFKGPKSYTGEDVIEIYRSIAQSRIA